MRILVGVCFLLALLFACTGCGEMPVAKSAGPAKKKKLKPPPAQPAVKIEIDPNKYASLDEALADVERLAAGASTDPKAGHELLKSETWIVRQGDKNVAALAARMADDGENLAVRITACRVLMKLGAPGRPAVTTATESSKKELRVKAIECLGRIDPVDPASVDKLIALLDDKDTAIRRAALLGLTATEKAGAKATQKLMDILNDTKEDETIRSLAKVALKSVDPRKGLMGADKARE